MDYVLTGAMGRLTNAFIPTFRIRWKFNEYSAWYLYLPLVLFYGKLCEPQSFLRHYKRIDKYEWLKC